MASSNRKRGGYDVLVMNPGGRMAKTRQRRSVRNPDRKRVVQMIKNLIALSKSSNKNEAEAAMRQAKRLMAKYNVKPEEVGMATTALARYTPSARRRKKTTKKKTAKRKTTARKKTTKKKTTKKKTSTRKKASKKKTTRKKTAKRKTTARKKSTKRAAPRKKTARKKTAKRSTARRTKRPATRGATMSPAALRLEVEIQTRVSAAPRVMERCRHALSAQTVAQLRAARDEARRAKRELASLRKKMAKLKGFPAKKRATLSKRAKTKEDQFERMVRRTIAALDKIKLKTTLSKSRTGKGSGVRGQKRPRVSSLAACSQAARRWKKSPAKVCGKHAPKAKAAAMFQAKQSWQSKARGSNKKTFGPKERKAILKNYYKIG